MINPVFLALEEIFCQVLLGEFDYKPYTLAVTIQALSDMAWSEVDKACNDCPNSIAIE